MKIFSNKIFIFLFTLLAFSIIAYFSIKLLPSKLITSELKFARIHSLLLAVNPIILLIWIRLGPIFGVAFLVAGLILIFLITVGSDIVWFSAHFLIISGTFLLFHYFYTAYTKAKSVNQLKLEDLKERKNTILNQYNKQNQISKALDKKMYRYSKLKEITEGLSSTLTLDDLAKNIVNKVINLIGKSDTCLLYLVDETRLELSLIASESSKREEHIKEKKGDIFDQWVFRQRQPLNIMDISKDFRFSIEDIKDLDRDFKSILSSPMITENRVVGVLRLDSHRPGAYNPDDLRLLDIVADLGAVSLENGMLYNRTEELAIRDDLTGLYVRRYFNQCFTEKFNQAAKYSKKLSVLMVDIDHFKQYNDTYGHTAGDIVLKEIAKVLSYNINKEDILARFGGEEFIILLSDLDKSSTIQKANHIRKEIENYPIMLRRKKTGITVSVGLANYPQDSKLKSELIHQADVNLYKAKTEGRNKVCYS